MLPLRLVSLLWLPSKCSHWHVLACMCRKYHLTTPPHQASSTKQLLPPTCLCPKQPSVSPIRSTASSPPSSSPPNTAQISVAQFLSFYNFGDCSPHTSTLSRPLAPFSYHRHLQSPPSANRSPVSLIPPRVVWVFAVPSFPAAQSSPVQAQFVMGSNPDCDIGSYHPTASHRASQSRKPISAFPTQRQPTN